MSDVQERPKAAEKWKPAANPWLIAVTVTLAAFMEILDTTIVNVSLPHIAGSMSVSYDDATWTLTSYLVANGIVLTISGWLGSLLGRKRYFLICIASFTVCSFLCGVATSLSQLIVFRLLQGFFGGGLQPNQQSIILDTFEPAQRGRAFSVTAVATIVAPVLGPTLGGIITDNWTWRWIFFINIPVGLLTLFGVFHLVEDPPWARRERQQIDYVGLGLITLGLGCLQVVLDRGEEEDWFGSPLIRVLAMCAAIGIIGAIVWLTLFAEHPVVCLAVFKDRNFAIGAFSIFSMASILYSSAVVIPQLSQQVLGYTATWAGLILSPGALLVCFMIPLVGRAMSLVQTRYIVASGFFALGLAMIYSHGLAPDIDFTTLAMMRMAQTIGIGMLFVPISTLTYSTLPQSLNRDGAALYTMFRNVAGSIGISLATALVVERSQVRQAYLVDNLTPFNQAYVDTIARNARTLMTIGTNGVAPADAQQMAVGMMNQTLHQQAAVLAYTDVFAYCAIMAFCIVPVAFLFKGTRGGGGAAAAH
jgi:DHA2 family multidrug resistance protein